MAPLKIVTHPDARLRSPAGLVGLVTPTITTLADDMAETMYVSGGVGLAAPQVGRSLRIFVADITEGGTGLRVFINPELLVIEGGVSDEEGCLSLPGKRRWVLRGSRVKVRALDEVGKPFELEAEGLLARVIQHEYDHLDGVLMIDRPSVSTG